MVNFPHLLVIYVCNESYSEISVIKTSISLIIIIPVLEQLKDCVKSSSK